MVDPQNIEEAKRLITIYNGLVADAEVSYNMAYELRAQLQALGVPYTEESRLQPSHIASFEVRVENP